MTTSVSGLNSFLRLLGVAVLCHGVGLGPTGDHPPGLVCAAETAVEPHAAGPATAQPEPVARRIGVARGFVVVVGDTGAELALKLARETELRVYVVSPGIYDINDGKCLNDADVFRRVVNNNVPAAESPRGWELYQVADRVMVSGKPFYSHPKYPVYDASVFNKALVASAGGRDLVWVNNSNLVCFGGLADTQRQLFQRAWRGPRPIHLALPPAEARRQRRKLGSRSSATVSPELKRDLYRGGPVVSLAA